MKAAPNNSENSAGLKDVRDRIDRIDDQILALLQERARLALEAHQAKHRLGLPLADLVREERILQRLARRADILPADAIRAIFAKIIDCCRKIESAADSETD